MSQPPDAADSAPPPAPRELGARATPGHTARPGAFATDALRTLARHIRASKWFAVNNLNRDFVGTRGFSVVFRRESLPRVESDFAYMKPYLDRALRDDCNAFYLNPLELKPGSRVDPHIDRSLRSYCAEVDPPLAVSVLYVEVPPAMAGGRLVLARGKRHLAHVTPQEGTLLVFEGDLTHSVERMDGIGARLSLVCEQYRLTDDELEQIPEYVVESRARRYDA